MRRGVVYHRARALQQRDFSGLTYGAITPTDIDAFLDFANSTFVFIEAKYGDQPLPLGQRLALERLCDACARGGLPTLGLVGTHRHPVTEAIDFAAMRVAEYRWKEAWKTPPRPMTVREAIDRFREKTRKAA